MNNHEIPLLGLALAIDSALVAFAFGLLLHACSTPQKIMRGFIICSVLGLFQFLMLWLGSYGGFVISFSGYGYLYQLLVAGIFFLLATKFFHESFENEKKPLHWGYFPLIVLAIATSIDALAAGISIGTLPRPYLIGLDVGLITFVLCSLFYSLARFFENIPERWLLRFAGMVFLVLSINIIWTQIIKGII